MVVDVSGLVAIDDAVVFVDNDNDDKGDDGDDDAVLLLLWCITPTLFFFIETEVALLAMPSRSVASVGVFNTMLGRNSLLSKNPFNNRVCMKMSVAESPTTTRDNDMRIRDQEPFWFALSCCVPMLWLLRMLLLSLLLLLLYLRGGAVFIVIVVSCSLGSACAWPSFQPTKVCTPISRMGREPRPLVRDNNRWQNQRNILLERSRMK